MPTEQTINLPKILKHQRKFVRDRKWEKFHTPKNVTMALAGEVGELLELFQWLSEEQSKKILRDPKKAQAVRNEIADILYYLVRLSDILNISIEEAFWEKVAQNERKYPVHLSKGNAKKYTELHGRIPKERWEPSKVSRQ